MTNLNSQVRAQIVKLANEAFLNKDIYQMSLESSSLDSGINEEIFGGNRIILFNKYDFNTIKVKKVHVSAGKENFYSKNSFLFDLELIDENNQGYYTTIYGDSSYSEHYTKKIFNETICRTFMFNKEDIVNKVAEYNNINEVTVSEKILTKIETFENCKDLPKAKYDICQMLIKYYEDLWVDLFKNKKDN